MYSLVIANQIECSKNDKIAKLKQLSITKRELTKNKKFVNLIQNVIKDSGRAKAPEEERNYIVTVASPSFLR